jgi:hypothetical protein
MEFMAAMTGVGLGLAEAGRLAKESVARFAEFEEGMIRIRQATDATTEQQSRLGEVFHQVARETGEDAVAVAGKFLDFAERSRVPLDDMIKLFPQMSRQAFLAGTDVEVVGRLVNTAVSGMNVPIARVPELSGNWNKTLRSVEPEFLTFLQRSEAQLQSLGLTGEKNLTALSGMFSEMSAAAGGGRRGAFRAAQELNQMIEQTLKTSSAFYPQVRNQLLEVQKAGGDVFEELYTSAKRMQELGLLEGTEQAQRMANRFGFSPKRSLGLASSWPSTTPLIAKSKKVEGQPVNSIKTPRSSPPIPSKACAISAKRGKT